MSRLCYRCVKPFTKGDVGKPSKVCPSCYPKYRRAVTLFYAAKQRAIKRNLSFDLDVDWIIERLEGKCSVTNLPFQFVRTGNNYGNRHSLTPSIDKVDPSKGYTKDNCRLVVWWYNVAKQQYNDLNVYHLCLAVVNSLEKNLVLSVEKKEKMQAETI